MGQKIPCAQCGKMLPPSTARTLDGLCKRCYESEQSSMMRPSCSTAIAQISAAHCIASGVGLFIVCIVLLWWPLASFRMWVKVVLSIVALIASLMLAGVAAVTGDNEDDEGFQILIALFAGLLISTVSLVLIWSQLASFGSWAKLGFSLGAIVLGIVFSFRAFSLAKRFCQQGISGLLPNVVKPKWKHSHDVVRKEAVESLHDKAILQQIAQQDVSCKVRLAAVRRLENQAVLAGIAIHDTTEDISKAAVERISDERLLLKVALECVEESAAGTSAIRKIRDEGVLRRIVGQTQGAIRLVAAESLGDLALLAKIALDDTCAATRWNAVNTRKVPESVLIEIAATDPDLAVRSLAAEQIDSPTARKEIEKRAREKPVCPYADLIFTWCFASKKEADQYFVCLRRAAVAGDALIHFVVRAISVHRVSYPHWVSFPYTFEGRGVPAPAKFGMYTVDSGILNYSGYVSEGRVLKVWTR